MIHSLIEFIDCCIQCAKLVNEGETSTTCSTLEDTNVICHHNESNFGRFSRNNKSLDKYNHLQFSLGGGVHVSVSAKENKCRYCQLQYLKQKVANKNTCNTRAKTEKEKQKLTIAV